MSNLVTTRYATALFETAKEHQLLDLFREQLKGVIEQIEGEEKFKQLLNSPQITGVQKKQIFEDVFKEAIHPYLLNFIFLVLDKGRQKYLKGIFLVFQDLVYKEKDILSVRVVSAVELKEEQLTALKEKLKSQFQKEIILQDKIDPSIVGGLIIYAGDKIIDGSVQNKLAKLKNNLKEIRLQEIGVN
jgi:F-type H+-transporting ATPase subunit delta